MKGGKNIMAFIHFVIIHPPSVVLKFDFHSRQQLLEKKKNRKGKRQKNITVWNITVLQNTTVLQIVRSKKKKYRKSKKT